MTDTDVIDATSVELDRRPDTPSLSLVPTVGAGELVQRLDVIRDAMRTAMKPDIDYGNIPGTDKPALLKPGAEKLSVLFQLDVQLVNEKAWGPGDHLTVMSRATVFHAPSGTRVGYGEGLCSTREKKYAYRNAERVCPECGKANIRRSKPKKDDPPNKEQGWYCWAKTDGCGAHFLAADERIIGQTVGQVDNPELPDLWNTVVKMAEKRARVDAVLAVTGASALFTQDVEPDTTPDDPPPASQGRSGQPPQHDADGYDPEHTLLGEKGKERVLTALGEAGFSLAQVPGVPGIDELTVADAHRVRAWLDRGSDIPTDLPAEKPDPEMDAIAAEVFGEPA